MRKRGKKPASNAPPGYLRYTPATERFQPLNKNKFNYHVRAGDIKYEIDGDGRMYSLESIDAIKAMVLHQNQEEKLKKEEVITKWLVPADLPAVLRLDYEVYAEYLVAELNVYSKWITKNTHIALCVFDKHDPNRCLAYISALPLPEKVILQVLRGDQEEIDITSDEIQTYDEPGAYTLLINSVVASQEKYLLRVLSGVMEYWKEQLPHRWIRRLYAQSTSDKGRQLLQRFNFSEIVVDKGDTIEVIDDAFYLDLQRPVRSPLFRDYQQAIEDSRKHSV